VIGERPFHIKRRYEERANRVFVHPFERRFNFQPNEPRVFQHPFYERGLGRAAAKPFSRGVGGLGSWLTNLVRKVDPISKTVLNYAEKNPWVEKVGIIAINAVPVVGTAASLTWAASKTFEDIRRNKEAQARAEAEYRALVAAAGGNVFNATLTNPNARTGAFAQSTKPAPTIPVIEAMTPVSANGRRSRFALRGLGASDAMHYPTLYRRYVAEFAARQAAGKATGTPLEFGQFVNMFSTWITQRGTAIRPGVAGLGEWDESAFFQEPASTWNWGNFFANVNVGLKIGTQAYSAIVQAQAQAKAIQAQANAAALAPTSAPAPPSSQPAPAAAQAPASSSMLPLLAIGGLALLAMKR